MPISKKNELLGFTIKNSLDMLLLDDIVDSKNNLDWKVTENYSENFEKNIFKKKHFKTYGLNSKLNLNSRLGFESLQNFDYKNRSNLFNLISSNIILNKKNLKNVDLDLNMVFENIPKNKKKNFLNDFPVIFICDNKNKRYNKKKIEQNIVYKLNLEIEKYNKNKVIGFKEIEEKIKKSIGIKKNLFLFLIKDELRISDSPFFYDSKKISYSELLNFNIFHIDLNTCKIKVIGNDINKLENGDYVHINLKKSQFEKSKTPYYYENYGNVKLRQVEPVLFLNDFLYENKNKVNYSYEPVMISNINKNKIILKNELNSLLSSNLNKNIKNKSYVIFYIDLKKKNVINKINKGKALRIVNNLEAKINKISDKNNNISNSMLIDNSKKYVEQVNFELESN
jgi:hypothetical protein